MATNYAPIQDMTCNQFIVQATLTNPQHASVLAFATQEAYKIAKEFNVDVNSKQDFAQFVIDIAVSVFILLLIYGILLKHLSLFMFLRISNQNYIQKDMYYCKHVVVNSTQPMMLLIIRSD